MVIAFGLAFCGGTVFLLDLVVEVSVKSFVFHCYQGFTINMVGVVKRVKSCTEKRNKSAGCTPNRVIGFIELTVLPLKRGQTAIGILLTGREVGGMISSELMVEFTSIVPQRIWGVGYRIYFETFWKTKRKRYLCSVRGRELLGDN